MNPWAGAGTEKQGESSKKEEDMAGTELWQIRVYGIVQGVGFRPAVDRHAHAAGVTGTVANRGSFVEINAEGTPEELNFFRKLIREKPPQRAVILKMAVKVLKREASASKRTSCGAESITAGNGGEQASSAGRLYRDFSIVESEKTSGEIFISPDIAICDTCRKELFDRTSRRYLHPFINCTCCGPRFSLLEALPYDRERTSMKKFPMCPGCEREYHDPASRFYDAQPVCCNDCGPRLYLMEMDKPAAGGMPAGPGTGEAAANKPEETVRPADPGAGALSGREAITRAREILSGGGIVAVKGIGGFHLACDATSQAAVERLRRLKKRPMKPFAVMAKDEKTADRECVVPDDRRQILTGHQKPILLLEKKPGGRICEAVAPDIPTVGLMLPYAPVQLLLFTYDDEFQANMPDVLVMTSGNVSGAPIASTDEEALSEIAGFCDAILSNDRDIRIRTDDSVMDFYDGGPYMVRRSRGYAPLPCLVTEDEAEAEDAPGAGGTPGAEAPHRNVLGIGGELKNTFCLARDGIFYPSAYVGDLADLRTVRALEDAVRKTETLLDMEPGLVVADLHPRYNSALVAEKIAKDNKIPLVRIQHHYAHVLSCMAENDYTGKTIGVSFDGTGYGTDGSIWGGEFLLSDPDGYVRCGHIRPFWQIGGDLSAKEGWRIAVSMIFDMFEKDTAAEVIGRPGLCGREKDTAAEAIEKLGLCDRQTARVQKVLWDRKMNAVRSTSAGRLFDAVSAILGIRLASTFEGEAATALMYRAMEGAPSGQGSGEDPSGQRSGTCSSVREGGPAFEEDVLPTDLLVEDMVRGRLRGEDSRLLAYRFHEGLARMIVDETVRISIRTGVRTAALTGGVFQNRLLLELTERGIKAHGIRVIRHHLVPPNDGGIGLGQAFYGMRYLKTHGRQEP